MKKRISWLALSASLLALASCGPTQSSGSVSIPDSGSPASSQQPSNSSSSSSSSSEASSASSETSGQSSLTSSSETSETSSQVSSESSIQLPPAPVNPPEPQGTFEAHGYKLNLVGDSGVTLSTEFLDDLTGDARVLLTVKEGERLKDISVVSSYGEAVPFSWFTNGATSQFTFNLTKATAAKESRIKLSLTQDVTITASTYQKGTDVPDGAYEALASLTQNGRWVWTTTDTDYSDPSKVLNQTKNEVIQSDDTKTGYIAHTVNGSLTTYFEAEEGDLGQTGSPAYVEVPSLKADGTVATEPEMNIWMGTPFPWGTVAYNGDFGIEGYGVSPFASMAVNQSGKLVSGADLLASLKKDWLPLVDSKNPDRIVFVDATVNGIAPTLARAIAVISERYLPNATSYPTIDPLRGTGAIAVEKKADSWSISSLDFTLPSYWKADPEADISAAVPAWTTWSLDAAVSGAGKEPDRTKAREEVGKGYLNGVTDSDPTVQKAWVSHADQLAKLAEGNFTLDVKTTGVVDGGLPEGLSSNGWGSYEGTIWSDLSNESDPWAATDLGLNFTVANGGSTSIIRTTDGVVLPDPAGDGYRTLYGYNYNNASSFTDFTDGLGQDPSGFHPELKAINSAFFESVESKDGNDVFVFHPDAKYDLSKTSFSQSLLGLVTNPLDTAFGQPAYDQSKQYQGFSNGQVKEIKVSFLADQSIRVDLTVNLLAPTGNVIQGTETLTYSNIGTTKIEDPKLLALKASAKSYLENEASVYGLAHAASERR